MALLQTISVDTAGNPPYAGVPLMLIKGTHVLLMLHRRCLERTHHSSIEFQGIIGGEIAIVF